MARVGESVGSGHRLGRRAIPTLKKITEAFEQFLHGQKLRLTKQRLEILRLIYATHKHVSAEELYDRLHGDGRASALRISRATVYRTLSLMAEGGFVQALEIGRDRGTLYEHTLGHEHHDHMICIECGRIIEFHDDELEQVQARAIKRQGFREVSHRLNVWGVCARCQKAGKSGSGGGPVSAERGRDQAGD